MTNIANTERYDCAPEQRPAALDAVRTVLADYADDTGVHLGVATWIVTATRSA
jgi:hypothetical protein